VNIRVGLMERRPKVSVVLRGRFVDGSGRQVPSGPREFTAPACLTPTNPAEDRFVVPDVTIGIGFHWERRQEQVFAGGLTIEKDGAGLTVINEIPLEDYVRSVIASEMSGESPIEFLRAHAVISRSWVAAAIACGDTVGEVRREGRTAAGEREIVVWYGRESHTRFDVCADDHCQRYQGVAPSESGNVRRAVAETAGEFLTFEGQVCDARFSKCCGGVTESFASAWEDRPVPYLEAVYDGEGGMPRVDDRWLRSAPPAWCNTTDRRLIAEILPGFDQETADFFRWTTAYTPERLGAIVGERTGTDVGPVAGLDPIVRGRSGRIVRLRIRGRSGTLIVGKELEIRRALSESHLYSSAFVADVRPERIVLHGAGWGHGVGLCQIGAGVQAYAGRSYRQILAHYYLGTEVVRRSFH